MPEIVLLIFEAMLSFVCLNLGLSGLETRQQKISALLVSAGVIMLCELLVLVRDLIFLS